MRRAKSWRPVSLLAATAACILLLGACSAGSLGSSDKGGGTTLSFLVDNADASVKPAQALAAAFHTKNPDITVQVQTRPGGSEGDNIVKTRLSTGEMTDLFLYNSGSLFQALNPKQNLAPLTGEAWANQVEDIFKPTVSVDNELYAAPITSASAGGILYNRKVYEKQGLQVPKSWAEFMANNAKLKAAGVDPVIQSYQDTWTSQLFVLADYHNVAAADPNWSQKYTAGQVKYAQEPAVKGFQRLEEVHKAGYENKDYRSMKFEAGMKLLASGKGAHFPMLTFAVGTLASDPQHINDVGFFGQPGDDAAKAGMTIWMPAGLYIPKSTEGGQLEAAKKFVAFVASAEGCEVQTKAYPPAGPYMVKGCELPADAPQAVKDVVAYVAKGNITPALEFSSPVKGPALEQITVEVGSGLKSAAEGAALYDKDVKKQAQQLGLKGWS
jgi:raffinose/stachyose/melibiose transport system substrate-binding protein